MALRICSAEELHTSHRWEQGEHEPFCPGRHAIEDGEWLADKSSRRQKLSRSVHFYLVNANRSICGYGHRDAGMLPYDPGTGLTTEPDPRFGAPQYRRACVHCSRATAPAEQRALEDRA